MIKKLDFKFKDTSKSSKESLTAFGAQELMNKVDELVEAVNSLLIEKELNQKVTVIKKKKDYINGLELATDKYIKTKKDKESVKEILKKVGKSIKE